MLIIFWKLRSLFLLWTSLVLSAVFILIKDPTVIERMFPDKDPNSIAFFCNNFLPWAQWCLCDVELYPDTYLYFLFVHLGFLLLAVFIFFNGQEFKNALLIFVLIHTVDVVDYLVMYGQTWFYYSSYPISWNMLRVVVFSLSIFNESLNLISERRHGYQRMD